MTSPTTSEKHLRILTQLVLRTEEGAESNTGKLDSQESSQRLLRSVLALHDLESLWSLASSHHVIVRAFGPLQRIAASSGYYDLATWARNAIDAERTRIENALSILETVCAVLQAEGCEVMVIKSLDHWPDLGNDLDLYTDALPTQVERVLTRLFQARRARRSCGDRLARKWNFILPGLQEAVEVHAGRLGQTGEHVALARGLVERSVLAQRGNHSFRVPCVEDRLMLTTLQRMYRHFYVRLCDIVDTAVLVDTQAVDFLELRSRAESAGIWPGVAAFLMLVSDYVERHGATALQLPAFVRTAATRIGDRLAFKNGFLRVPIVPDAAGLYVSELSNFVVRREIWGTFRLSLLPGLAAAAAVELKVAGNNKWVW